jgi:hypothetical protein
VGLYLAAGPALASGVLPLHGAFGNAAGCRLYLNGDRSGDGLVVVSPYTLTIGNTGCRLERLVAARSGSEFEVAAACATAERGASTHESIIVAHHGAEGVFVTRGGTEHGPLLPCGDTETLFDPPGERA